MKRKALFKKLLAVGLAATFALSSVSGALATEEPGTELTTEAISEMATEAETETVTEAAAEAVSETPAAAETAEFGAETLNEKGVQEEILVYYENEDGTMLNETGVLYAELSTWVDSAFIPVPSGYELASQNSVLIEDTWIQVKVRPVEEAEEVDIYVNYWDQVNNKQAGEGSITVPADTVKINTADLTDVPSGYELATLGEVDIMDHAIYVEVRPIEEAKEVDIYVNYWDQVNNKQAGEGSITVPADTVKINTADLTDVPSGYELATLGEVDIMDYAIYVEVRPIQQNTRMISVWMYDANDNTPYCEGESVEVTVIERDGYEYVDVNSLPMMAGYTTADATDDGLIPLDGSELIIYVTPLEAPSQVEVTVEYVDVENGNHLVGYETVMADPEDYNVNTSVLTKIPEGYELVYTGDLEIRETSAGTKAATAKVRPVAATKEIGVNYYDRENGVQIAESSVTVDANAIHVNTSLLTDVPEGYELAVTGDILINDGWIFAEVRKVTTKEIGVNYYDRENGVQIAESSVTVDVDAIHVNTSLLTDVPEGYELAVTGDLQIMDGWIFAEVRKIADTKEIGVNYYDRENGVQIAESSVTVDANAIHVNTSLLTDVPEGYELAVTGDLQIMDGWIFAEVRRITTKTVGVNYYDRENGVQVAESSVTVDADAIHVNTSLLTDVPEGYELVVTGDLQIMDGWIFAEVRRITTKTVGVNYYDRENGVQVAESSVTVDADAIHVNTSLLTDVPEGYELVVTGDLQIMDGWIFAEVRKTEMTVAVRYYIAAEDKYVEGQPVTVSRDAVYINTTTLTDVPEGYEIVWLGDEPIRDGAVTVEIRAIETTKEVAVKYYIEAEDRTIDGQSVKVDKDASYINTGILKDVPNGYELVWTGDLPIENGTVVVEIRAKKLDVDFVIADSNMGSFADTAYAGMTIVSFTDLEASTGTQYGIPAVKAAEGYVFTGWKDSTGAILWDAMKTTFEVVPGMGIYMEGAANGTLVLTAQFAPAETEPETTAPTEPETTPVTEPETTAPTEPETTVPDETETPVSEPETTVDEPTDDGWDDGEEEETQGAGAETNESETKAAADAAEASADGSVKTGDETPLGLYASVMVLAAAVIIGVLAKVRRTQR